MKFCRDNNDINCLMERFDPQFNSLKGVDSEHFIVFSAYHHNKKEISKNIQYIDLPAKLDTIKPKANVKMQNDQKPEPMVVVPPEISPSQIHAPIPLLQQTPGSLFSPNVPIMKSESFGIVPSQPNSIPSFVSMIPARDDKSLFPSFLDPLPIKSSVSQAFQNDTNEPMRISEINIPFRHENISTLSQYLPAHINDNTISMGISQNLFTPTETNFDIHKSNASVQEPFLPELQSDISIPAPTTFFHKFFKYFSSI